jgi:regulator of sirC expression with transglutaminase-like and TPR domain
MRCEMLDFVKKYWIIISAIGLVLIVYFSSSGPAQTASFEARVDSILPKDRTNFNFTNTVLRLSALVDPDMDVAWTDKELSRMAGELKSDIGDEGNPEKIISAFNNYFFTRQSFRFDDNFLAIEQSKTDVPVEELINFHSIEKVLKRRQGICLSISLIYLMLGDKLHLPLYGVLMPGHFFVRYHEPGRAGINIETTYSGVEYYGYKEGYGVDLLDKNKMSYGKELDKYQVLGAYMSNLGNFFISIGRDKKAAVLLKKSIEFSPDTAEAYENMGVLCELEKNQESAIGNYQKALDIYPRIPSAHARLGMIYLSQKRYTLAQNELEDALKSNTSNAELKAALEKVKSRSGE